MTPATQALIAELEKCNEECRHFCEDVSNRAIAALRAADDRERELTEALERIVGAVEYSIEAWTTEIQRKLIDSNHLTTATIIRDHLTDVLKGQNT